MNWKMEKQKVWKLAVIFFAAMGAFTLLSRAAYQHGIAEVTTQAPTGGTISHQVILNGKTMQNQEQAVTTEAGLRIAGVSVNEGQQVMLLLDVYETYLPLAREKGLNLFLSLPEELGQKGSWDRERIVQVLSILLDNAMSYTPAPGDIRLELCWGRGCARIRVSDTGPGVPDQEKNRIFQRFHRGEKARSHRGHFGLGLSIAWEIVKFHRGKLWVEDAPGGGAAFVLELPVS